MNLRSSYHPRKMISPLISNALSGISSIAQPVSSMAAFSYFISGSFQFQPNKFINLLPTALIFNSIVMDFCNHIRLSLIMPKKA